MKPRIWALAAALAVMAGAGRAQPVTPDYPPLRADFPREGAYCRLKQDVDPADLERRLGASDFVAWSEGQDLHVVVRAPTQPTFCCTIQVPLARVGTSDLWTTSLRIPRLDEAVILLAYLQMADPRRELRSRGEYRGPKARRPAPESTPLQGTVSEISIDSAALGYATPVGVYRPPASAGPVRAVVYLADGAVQAYAPVLERLILDRRIPPTMIVGFAAYASAGPDAAARSALRDAQYRRGVDPAEMARHDRFVFDEVIPQVERGLGGRLTRLTAGASNGGGWAFTTALARPDLFRATVAMSPAVRPEQLAGLAAAKGQSYFISAGIFEGLVNARAAYDHLGPGPARRCLLEGVDGHSASLYHDVFPLAVEAAFKRDGCPAWPDPSPRP